MQRLSAQPSISHLPAASSSPMLVEIQKVQRRRGHCFDVMQVK